jgi:hypothetical protein
MCLTDTHTHNTAHTAHDEHTEFLGSDGQLLCDELEVVAVGQIDELGQQNGGEVAEEVLEAGFVEEVNREEVEWELGLAPPAQEEGQVVGEQRLRRGIGERQRDVLDDVGHEVGHLLCFVSAAFVVIFNLVLFVVAVALLLFSLARRLGCRCGLGRGFLLFSTATADDAQLEQDALLVVRRHARNLPEREQGGDSALLGMVLACEHTHAQGEKKRVEKK